MRFEPLVGLFNQSPKVRRTVSHNERSMDMLAAIFRNTDNSALANLWKLIDHRFDIFRMDV